MSKLLCINKCYLKLPDNFNGTLGDMLMLMANCCKQSEAYDEVVIKPEIDLEGLLKTKRVKCTMNYEIIEI